MGGNAEVDDDTHGMDHQASITAADMTTTKALNSAKGMGDKLKSLYLEAKPITEINDSRPVREAVEGIYKAMAMFDEATKVLGKMKAQEEAEEAAVAAQEKAKKKSSLFMGLKLAAEDEEPEEKQASDDEKQASEEGKEASINDPTAVKFGGLMLAGIMDEAKTSPEATPGGAFLMNQVSPSSGSGSGAGGLDGMLPEGEAGGAEGALGGAADAAGELAEALPLAAV